jgi:hypothetical protein
VLLSKETDGPFAQALLLSPRNIVAAPQGILFSGADQNIRWLH